MNKGQGNQMAYARQDGGRGILIEDDTLYSPEDICELLGIGAETLTDWYEIGLEHWRFGPADNSKKKVWGRQLKRFAEAFSLAMQIVRLRDLRLAQKQREDEEKRPPKKRGKAPPPG